MGDNFRQQLTECLRLLFAGKHFPPSCPSLYSNFFYKIVSPPASVTAAIGMWHFTRVAGQAGLNSLLLSRCQIYAMHQLFAETSAIPPSPGKTMLFPCRAPTHLAWRLEVGLCCQSLPLGYSFFCCSCSN